MTYAIHPNCPTRGKDGKHRALIVDLDGTLALMVPKEEGGRGPFEWERVGEDLPNAAVRSLLWRYAGDHCILIVTGRSEACRQETTKWLAENDIQYCALWMRPDDDEHKYLKDAVIKERVWEREIRGRFSVTFVLEDRSAVVHYWRGLGLTCFQVADGDF